MKKRKIFALLISLTLLGLIFYKIDFSKLVDTFKLFDLKNLWIIFPVYISTLYLRGVRWKALLLDKEKYSSFNLASIFTVGSMLNVYLPARAGDIYRAYYLGDKKQEKKMKIFGSIILERMFDGICVFLILLGAVLLYCNHQWILNIAYLIGTIFIGSFIAAYLVFKFNKVDYICEKLKDFCKFFPNFICRKLTLLIDKINVHTNSFIDGFEVLNSLKYTSCAFMMSVVIWLIECYVTILIINSFHMNLSFSAAFFVISLISFSTVIPSTSVFLGPYQYAYILALGIYGVDKSTALAISTVHQGILVVILSVIGLFYLIKFNFSMKDATQNCIDEDCVIIETPQDALKN